MLPLGCSSLGRDARDVTYEERHDVIDNLLNRHRLQALQVVAVDASVHFVGVFMKHASDLVRITVSIDLQAAKRELGAHGAGVAAKLSRLQKRESSILTWRILVSKRIS